MARETDLRDTTEDWRERARCERRLVRGDGASSSSLCKDKEEKRSKDVDNKHTLGVPVTPP